MTNETESSDLSFKRQRSRERTEFESCLFASKCLLPKCLSFQRNWHLPLKRREAVKGKSWRWFRDFTAQAVVLHWHEMHQLFFRRQCAWRKRPSVPHTRRRNCAQVYVEKGPGCVQCKTLPWGPKSTASSHCSVSLRLNNPNLSSVSSPFDQSSHHCQQPVASTGLLYIGCDQRCSPVPFCLFKNVCRGLGATRCSSGSFVQNKNTHRSRGVQPQPQLNNSTKVRRQWCKGTQKIFGVQGVCPW